MSSIKILDYSDKSFVVSGEDTKLIKENLRNIGGKWSSNLKDENGNKYGAWVFSIKKKEEVENVLNSMFTTPSTSPRKLLVPPKIKKKKNIFEDRMNILESRVYKLECIIGTFN